ncbi:hypothetical protein OQA88_12070 [Cercophora sp. LCS_1]
MSKKRPPKPPKPNPITSAISSWLTALPDPPSDPDSLLTTAPKRWVVYEPLILLPSGSFTSSPWMSLLPSLPPDQQSSLWISILKSIAPKCTHLAINEGIPLRDASSSSQQENTLRSPSGLRLLYGNFGPADVASPTPQDFDTAFWASARQNGIIQTWAPRWTMFSRGNIKEKARLLDFHAHHQEGLGHGRVVTTRNAWAVDLYAGIGYFVFSYAKLGMRVLCWEINPWSVEGLRRGAVANGFSVRVVRGDELGDNKKIKLGGEQVVVFEESNEMCAARMEDLELEVLHVNCGFLPTSLPSWKTAWKVVVKKGGWCHLHENVGVEDIERRKQEVQDMFGDWGRDEGVECTMEHVELVKTFAPGVWHCVFDVYVHR